MNFKIIFLSLLFLLLMNLSSAALLEEKWSYPTGAVNKIFFEDLDGDGSPEIIAWVRDTILALNLQGSLLWSFKKDNLLSVTVSDLNSDGRKEVILSSGKRMAGIERSFLWILNYRGRLILKYPASKVALTLFLKDIKTLDLDGNGYKEIIAGTSQGVCAFGDKYEGILWYNKDEIPDQIEQIITPDITGDGKGEILARSFSAIYLVSYTGNLSWSYPLLNGIKTFNVGKIYSRMPEAIILTSGQEMSILDKDGNLTKKVAIPAGINSVFTGNPLYDSYHEIILLAEREIYLLDSNLNLEANYSFSNGGDVKAVFLENLDLDKEPEIVVFTNKKIYGFWQNLTPKFTFDIPYSVHTVFFLNDPASVLLTSKGITHFFKVNKNFWRKKLGDEWYEKALLSYNQSHYENATYCLSHAREIYEKGDCLSDLPKCEELLQEIKKKQHIIKVQLAESYYEKALLFYNQSHYENATSYLNLARKLFLEERVIDGILKCTRMLGKIKETTLATTTSVPSTSTSLKEEPSLHNSGKLILGGMLLLLTIPLLIFILRKKSKGKLK